MTEPVTTTLGLKLGPMIAGFAGGVVSLSNLRSLTYPQALMAVVAGALCANYLTPSAVKVFAIPAELNLGIAFVIGLVGMNIVPAVKAVLSPGFFRSVLSRLLGLPGTPPTQGDGGSK